MIKCFSDKPIIIDDSKDSIFLAGPTRRNALFKDSWRKEACDILESIGYNGIVYIPEYEASTVSVDLLHQAPWEREGLVAAKKILFYIPRTMPDMPGLTTNVEYGMYLARKPDSIILACPEWACKNSYLEWLYSIECPEKEIFTTLESALKSLKNN